jgi:polysaccharide deacetylase family protein (PEP-CTERM system associated)
MKVVNALSFDVEDWFHGFISTYNRIERWPYYETRVVVDTQKVLAILRRYNVKATFFILGYIASVCPDLVRQIHKEGHEIASHGYFHTRIYNQTPYQFENDLKQSIKILEQITQEKVLGYRAPDFSITPRNLWAFEIIAKMKLKYDSSIFPIKNHIYGIPGSPRYPYAIKTTPSWELLEFPLSTLRLLKKNIPIAGGFYLRALPFTLIRIGIKKINRTNKPVIIYLHPWELNPDCPKLEGQIFHRLIYKYNLATTGKKLERLLREFNFCPIREILKNSRR